MASRCVVFPHIPLQKKSTSLPMPQKSMPPIISWFFETTTASFIHATSERKWLLFVSESDTRIGLALFAEHISSSKYCVHVSRLEMSLPPLLLPSRWARTKRIGTSNCTILWETTTGQSNDRCLVAVVKFWRTEEGHCGIYRTTMKR